MLEVRSLIKAFLCSHINGVKLMRLAGCRCEDNKCVFLYLHLNLNAVPLF